MLYYRSTAATGLGPLAGLKPSENQAMMQIGTIVGKMLDLLAGLKLIKKRDERVKIVEVAKGWTRLRA